MNVFSVVLRLSTDLIILALGDQHKSSVFCRCYHAAGVSVQFPCMVASGFPRADSRYSVPIELCGRVTFVTYVGLVSNTV